MPVSHYLYFCFPTFINALKRISLKIYPAVFTNNKKLNYEKAHDQICLCPGRISGHF